jgi:chromosome segregation ATPase
MTVKERIEAAKSSLEKAEKAKTVAETQLETANKQCDEVIASMKEYGVDPETIQGEIDRLTNEVNTELDEIEKAIPQV